MHKWISGGGGGGGGGGHFKHISTWVSRAVTCRAISGFHLLGGAGGKLPPQTLNLPPQSNSWKIFSDSWKIFSYKQPFMLAISLVFEFFSHCHLSFVNFLYYLNLLNSVYLVLLYYSHCIIQVSSPSLLLGRVLLASCHWNFAQLLLLC